MIYKGQRLGKKGHFAPRQRVGRVQTGYAPGNFREPSPDWNALRFRIVALGYRPRHGGELAVGV